MTLRYVVASFLCQGSLTATSTPGGIDMGVRPSLDGLPAEAEKCRLVGVCRAGTRKLGNENAKGLVAAASTARANALPPWLRANMNFASWNGQWAITSLEGAGWSRPWRR